MHAAESALQRALEALEHERAEREQMLQQLDRDMKALVHQRAGVLQEEERGRQDVLNLAVLVANTEQSLSQLTTRAQEISERESRLDVSVKTVRCTTIPRRIGAGVAPVLSGSGAGGEQPSRTATAVEQEGDGRALELTK